MLAELQQHIFERHIISALLGVPDRLSPLLELDISLLESRQNIQMDRGLEAVRGELN